MPKENRKQIILQSLASLLEERNLSKVTTALLAEKSSITEAALYRHFPSKRSIYLELFSFCDETIISKCAEIKRAKTAQNKKQKIYLCFASYLLRRIRALQDFYQERL